MWKDLLGSKVQDEPFSWKAQPRIDSTSDF